MKKILFIFILMFFPYFIFAKLGLGYLFGDKLVMKKFYISASSHFVEKLKDRPLKSQKIAFDNMSVRSSSKAVNLDSLFMKKDFRKSPFSSFANDYDVYSVGGYFRYSNFMFFDIIPKHPIRILENARSLSLDVQGIAFTRIFFYFRSNGFKRRVSVSLGDNLWNKLVLGLDFLDDGRRYVLYKIGVSYDGEITGFDGDLNFFSLLIGNLFIYDYLQDEYSFSPSYREFANFESFSSELWSYNLAGRFVDGIARVLRYDKPLIRKDNISYLSLNASLDLHEQRDLLIFFPRRLYRQDRDHYITMFVGGFEGGEQISLIFQDAGGRYFELEFGVVDFLGWRIFRTKIFNLGLRFFYDQVNDFRYVYLVGLKIIPGDGNLLLNIDQIESWAIKF